MGRCTEAIINDIFKQERRAGDLLQIIAAEFESDPASVTCFDLRIVEETKKVSEELRKLTSEYYGEPYKVEL